MQFSGCPGGSEGRDNIGREGGSRELREEDTGTAKARRETVSKECLGGSRRIDPCPTS